MKTREKVILTIGTLGFISQIVAQFIGYDPNYLIVGGALALLGVAPLLRLDEHGRDHPSSKEEQP